MLFFFKASLLALLVLFSGKAVAQDYTLVSREFDARLLNYDEKRFLQTALAFEGYYKGLLDGSWGGNSQAALERFTAQEFQTGKPLQLHAAALVIGALDTFSLNGWEVVYLDWLDISLLSPADALVEGEHTKGFANYEHKNSSLGYSFSRGNISDTISIHNYVLAQAKLYPEPYKVRKPHIIVSSVTTSEGGTLYARSDLRNGAWSTTMLSALPQDAGVLAAVSASISAGIAPSLAIPENGALDEIVEVTLSMLEAKSDDQAPNGVSADAMSQDEESPSETVNASTGTGFFVSPDGHVLTNAHVVSKCIAVFVNEEPAEVRDLNSDMDLALLKVEGVAIKRVAEFSSSGAKLNSNVTVIGYPFSDILGGINATRGAVSSVKGIGGDVSRMQLTAPVQPGNSGGPVLADNGSVVGIVVSRLDKDSIKDLYGDIPENINFAIRGEIAKLYLNSNGVEPVVVEKGILIAPEELAETSSEFTVFIRCER